MTDPNPFLPTTDAPAPKRRSGRPAVDEIARRDVRVTVRLNQAEADKFDAMGGATWMRRALARARP